MSLKLLPITAVMPATEPLDPRGRAVGPVPQVDGHAGRVGCVVQCALSAACDVAQELPGRAEDERIRAGVAFQVSGRSAAAGALDIERVCGPLRNHIPGEAGAIELDRHTVEAVGGAVLDRRVLDREDVARGAGLAVDPMFPPLPANPIVSPAGMDPSGLPSKVKSRLVLPLLGVATY